MRTRLLSLFLFMVLLLPRFGNAQITWQPTPLPLVTAAGANWQINGEPIFFAGAFYYPAGPTIHFDERLMKRVGEYLGVPLYVDTTMEAYSVVLVPIGGAVMKPYERPRTGELAGTTGSRPPSWPVQLGAELPSATGRVGIQTPPVHMEEPLVVAEAARAVGTVGPVGIVAPQAVGTVGVAAVARPSVTRTVVESVPAPTRNTGISIDFNGARWFSAGAAVPYSADRFIPMGDYRSFPVYRERGSTGDIIWVTVVHDGPLAPYSRR
jgi:hypothetical protein